jgi:hypothetical protein
MGEPLKRNIGYLDSVHTNMSFPLDEFTCETIRKHFRRKKLEWSEDYFIQVLETSSYKHDIYWAVIALRDCGTSKSVPALKAKLLYPMRDVMSTSILTIAHIAGAAESSFYGEALLNPKYREKGYAMWAIRVAADQRAAEAVLSYFRKNMSKIRLGKLYNATLADGLEYLQKYIDTQPGVSEFFQQIDECWESLAEGERQEISRRVSYYSVRK